MVTTAAGTRRRPPRSAAPPPRRSRPRVASVLAGAALVAGALAGCAGRAPRTPLPSPPPPAVAPAAARPRPAAGYAGLRDTLDAPDSTRLAGRRIVLDPGHGGYFKGCIGPGGLTEAEVNLGVALALDTLLEARGARVLLTRHRDRDFLTPADSSLKADLAERVRRANAFGADLFVSIHHNADPGGSHDVNETQTYYKLGDDGPSYDAATDVHRSLVRNVGIATQKLLPGNFAVVRGVDAPALLTETSYLTDPDVEARLRTGAARRIEAEAILLGIERFFARKAPAIERFEAARSGSEGAAGPLLGGFPVLTARVRGPFDEAILRLDGGRVSPLVLGDSLWWRPQRALAAGPHVATLAVRLAGEGASRATQLPFRLVKPFERIAADFPGQPGWIAGDPIALRVRALDGDGLLLASESLAVRVRARHASPRETVLVVRDGIAWGYFRGAAGTGRRAAAARPGFTISRDRLVTGEAGSHLPGDAHATLGRLDRASPLATWRVGYAKDMPGDSALRGAPGTTGPDPGLAWLNRDGFVSLSTDSTGRVRVPRLPGFRAWGDGAAWPPRFVAIAGGALRNRRVVLDPEGGGDDAGGMGASGTRAATLNLEVARALAGMLSAAGAEVLLTREGDAAVSEVERVQRAEGFRPDRYLCIGHAAAPPLAGHYFSSAAGQRWGGRVAAACARLGLTDSLPVADVARYALTQTSAVALYASLARVDDPASEARLLAPGTLRREACALFVALAQEFAPGTAWSVDTVGVRDAAGAPLPGAIVTLGGALVLQADAEGRVLVPRTEPGPLELEVMDSRAIPRTLLLDSVGGRVPAAAR